MAAPDPGHPRSNVSTLQEERSECPALLLLISETSDLRASARSAHRRVRTWVSKREAAAGEFTGDPADAATYQWIVDARSVTAVICLNDDARAQRAVAALRDVRADAAVLVLSEALDEAGGDGTLTRSGELRDVLRLDLEDELVRLEAERRVFCLRAFADHADIVPILIHPDPDPDALSSALAVRTVLGRNDRTAPIITSLAMRRPENRRMAELLGMHVTQVTREEIAQLSRVIVVDMQPADVIGPDTLAAVIDHHPPEPEYQADFLDVRPEYGSVASMMTEYLRACDEDAVGTGLATALIHGIRTDTDFLTRGVVASDVEAYAFLQTHCDLTLLRRIQEPSYPESAIRAYGRALHNVCIADGIAVAFAGELDDDESHILADLADFCMGIEGVTRAVTSGVVANKLVLTLRDTGRDGGVAEIARVIGEKGGTGGGHPTMARAVIPLESVPDWSEENAEAAILELVRSAAADG